MNEFIAHFPKFEVWLGLHPRSASTSAGGRTHTNGANMESLLVMAQNLLLAW